MFGFKWGFVLFFIYSIECFACGSLGTNRHENPDGSIGGLISTSAKVAATAYVGFNARVCDNAWVDDNAQILDHAIVKEDAWIREYSIISGMASVAGSAVIWGSKNAPARVEDDGKVYGSAKILTGSKIQGKAEVYGRVSLKDSRVYGKAKVCSGYILNDQDIEDDYFCSDEATTSYLKVRLLSYKEGFFNKFTNRIIFEAENHSFSLDKNVFQIFINGEQIDPMKITSNLKRVYIESEFIVEGENEIIFSGRDEFNKEIIEEKFSFIVGTGSKTIDLVLPDDIPESYPNLRIKFIYEGKEYEGISSYENGAINIEGLPSNVEDIGVKLTGVGRKSLIVEEYLKLEDIPLSLTAIEIPTYQNNILDFSEGLSGWSVSHPSNIQIIGTGTSARALINPDNRSRVELAKTVRLNQQEKGFGLKFNINSNILRVYDSTDKVQVILVSHEDKNIEVFDYTFEQMKLFQTEKNNETEMSVFLPNNSISKLEFSVVIRLFSNEFENFQNSGWVEVRGIELSKIYIEFEPMNFYALNPDGKVPAIPSLNPSGGPDCSDIRYNIEKIKTLKNGEENILFFSAGKTPMMNVLGGQSFEENRIYGKIEIMGIPKNKILDIQLVGEQKGVQVFSVSLSKCSLEKLHQPGEDPTEPLILVHNKNLVHNLFSVSSFLLRNVSTSEGFGSFLKGAEISLRLKVEMRDILGYAYSNPILKKVLSSPELSYTDSYKPLENIEHYESSMPKIMRTGGDKWIQPVYAPIIKRIIDRFRFYPRSWKVNDMTKINGGRFPIHSTHDSGLDADVIFNEVDDLKFDLSQNYSKSQWKDITNTIEEFFTLNKDDHGYIRDYYLTVKKALIAKKYIESRFKNRCIGDRFISLTSEKGTGSLVRDVVGHTDHLHIRFNAVSWDGYAINIPRDNSNNPLQRFPLDADIDNFWFSLDNDGKNLWIEPKEDFEGVYGQRRILWRFQDRMGFDDSDLVAEYGEWTSGKDTKPQKDIKKPHILENDILRYIYITIGNEGTGWCVEKKLEIDPSFFKRSKKFKRFKWSYAKEDTGYRAIWEK